LLELVGDARFVLLGWASHGTHDFYRARADSTKRLIREKSFTAVAAVADRPDASLELGHPLAESRDPGRPEPCRFAPEHQPGVVRWRPLA
jgi:hypothetical protein